MGGDCPFALFREVPDLCKVIYRVLRHYGNSTAHYSVFIIYNTTKAIFGTLYRYDNCKSTEQTRAYRAQTKRFYTRRVQCNGARCALKSRVQPRDFFFVPARRRERADNHEVLFPDL